ncbi:unnamed protein product [Pylaiella littoralis]
MEDYGGAQFHHHHHHQQQRSLLELFTVSEDDGVYVLIAGLVLVGLTVIACCYCNVYDPLRLWTIKKAKQYCTKKPKAPPPPPPDPPMTPERRHWYLNRTLKIDGEDREELGPQGLKTGLRGGWYGARNGGFDV